MLSPTSSEKHRLWKPKQWQLNHVLLTKVVLSQYFWPISWILLMASQSIKPFGLRPHGLLTQSLLGPPKFIPANTKNTANQKAKSDLQIHWLGHDPLLQSYIYFLTSWAKQLRQGLEGIYSEDPGFDQNMVQGTGYDCGPGSGIHQFKEYVDWERKWLELY